MPEIELLINSDRVVCGCVREINGEIKIEKERERRERKKEKEKLCI